DERFIEGTYVHEQNNQTYRMFKMTKDGFMLVAMGFTDKKFMDTKVNYIDSFNGMQKQLEQQAQRQFFIPETVDQQIEREKLALRKRTADTSRAREIRSWAKALNNTKEVISLATPKVLSMLLDIPEEQLALEGR
ncbi:Rha family transcriptional regulator, partial [Staphylococcus aureus]|uniref:Rha family transcriptional regulator n=2 Tax=Bacilli TaxID=91061 RepID=UPI0022FE2521